MALYPCDFGSHRYREAQQTMYPAVVDGIQAERRKLRLCPSHFSVMFQQLESRAQHADGRGDDGDETICYQCRQPLSPPVAQLFVTVYQKGEERDDFWAPMHGHCAPEVMHAWLIELDVP